MVLKYGVIIVSCLSALTAAVTTSARSEVLVFVFTGIGVLWFILIATLSLIGTFGSAKHDDNAQAVLSILLRRSPPRRRTAKAANDTQKINTHKPDSP